MFGVFTGCCTGKRVFEMSMPNAPEAPTNLDSQRLTCRGINKLTNVRSSNLCDGPKHRTLNEVRTKISSDSETRSLIFFTYFIVIIRPGSFVLFLIVTLKATMTQR